MLLTVGLGNNNSCLWSTHLQFRETEQLQPWVPLVRLALFQPALLCSTSQFFLHLILLLLELVSQLVPVNIGIIEKSKENPIKKKKKLSKSQTQTSNITKLLSFKIKVFKSVSVSHIKSLNGTNN